MALTSASTAAEEQQINQGRKKASFCATSITPEKKKES